MKTNKIKTIGVTALFTIVLMAAGQTSFAQDKPQKERPTFEKLLGDMDANEDGKLSQDEVKGRLKENFDKVDADSDGFVTKEEFDNAPKPERTRPARRK